MSVFSNLYNEYENTKDVCKFCIDHEADDVATRFLLIRSLDKNNLKDIIKEYSTENEEGNIRYLTEKAYNSDVSIPELIEYIESQRVELIKKREAELEGLSDILAQFPIVNCGVRNDKVDTIIKSFVRNKSLKSMGAINKELENAVLPRIRQYILWSYYNQTSNDIIELFFLKHSAIIPTLRKIHDIDFFIKVGNNIVPFDLKFTHISDNYFDLASQGIIRNNNPERHDDFYTRILPEQSEIKCIKNFYNTFKQNHRDVNLPNYGNLEKMTYATC